VSAPAAAPFLSIVAPVFNEGAVVAELVRRCVSAGEACGVPFEVVIVDDASSDGTAELLRRVSTDPRVVPAILDVNAGQFGATREGLRRARGEVVCVLDGDLQDPPEVIPELVAAWRSHQVDDATVVFATKRRRSDPLWFRVGRAGYRLGQALVGASIPSGSGSFSLCSRRMAQEAAKVPMRSANLAAVYVALGARPVTVPYDKSARYDDNSRVGFRGLVKEAFGSLRLLGPFGSKALGPASPLAPRPSTWPVLLGLAPLLLLAVALFAARISFAFRHVGFAQDDWEWLWHARSLTSFVGLLDPFGRDLFRPAAWAHYLVFPAIFGSNASILAVWFVCLGVVANAGLARALTLSGWSIPAAIFTACVGFGLRATSESLKLVSLNEVTIARACLALVLCSLLGTRRDVRVWLPALAAGVLAHESMFTVLPIAVLLAFAGGGVERVVVVARDASWRRFALAWGALLAFRIVMYGAAPHGSHVLTIDAVARNAAFFLDALRITPPDATLPLGLAVLAGVVLALPDPAARRRTFAALLVALAAYAPFLLQRDYVSHYFLSVSVVFLAAASAAAFAVRTWSPFVLCLAALLSIPRALPDPLYPDRLPDRVLAHVREQLPAPSDAVLDVFFIEPAGRASTIRDGFLQLRSPWLSAIGSGYEWDAQGRPTWKVYPVMALAATWPDRSIRAHVIDDSVARRLCFRDDDVLVRIDDAHGDGVSAVGVSNARLRLDLFSPAPPIADEVLAEALSTACEARLGRTESTLLESTPALDEAFEGRSLDRVAALPELRALVESGYRGLSLPPPPLP